MKHQHDPQRWTEDKLEVPQALRAALGDARADGPNAEQLARLMAAVSVPIESTAPGATPAQVGAGLRVLRPLGKLIAIAAVVAAIGYGAMRGTMSPSAPTSERSRDAPFPVTVPAEAGRAASAARDMPVSAATETTSDGPQPEPPVVELRTRRAPSQRPHVNPADEIALLQRAKRTIAAEPARALELLATHRRDFPAGAFVEEREALMIEAQVALGRIAQARKAHAAFAARYPQSAYMRRLDGLLSE